VIYYINIEYSKGLYKSETKKKKADKVKTALLEVINNTPDDHEIERITVYHDIANF